jgi:chemotaxis signal transduction protein
VSDPVSRGTSRLLTFEVGEMVFALPIAAVAEVTEVGHIAAVPTLPRSVAGVTNLHGDALPVVERAALLPLGGEELQPPRHLLVLAKSPDDASRYGLPVDAIRGLVDGEGGTALGEDAIAERRPIDGRVVCVLDPKRLLARAMQVIERSAEGADRDPKGGQA